MRWTLPNILTLLRLLAAPCVALIFVMLPRGAADWAALGIFMVASVTDWLDGYIARAWKLESRFGAMLDPIADKAMVIIAIAVVLSQSFHSVWYVLPCAMILFREVFVSGLREFLGDTAGTLKVTKLAKWKTAAQMVAIAVLLARGGFEHMFNLAPEAANSGFAALGLQWCSAGGMALLWIAASLTVITGADYFLKARPYLKDD